MAQIIKNLPAVWETWVQSLCWEDNVEKNWQATPVLLPRESHGQKNLAGKSQWGRKKLDMTESHTHTHTHMVQVKGMAMI